MLGGTCWTTKCCHHWPRTHKIKLKGSHYLSLIYNKNIQPLPHLFISELKHSFTHSCFFVPCDSNEISNILGTLGNKGNMLCDITFRYIRLVENKLIPALVHIFNLCLERGVYPNLMKCARVVPLFKSGSRTDLNNYRPIHSVPRKPKNGKNW